VTASVACPFELGDQSVPDVLAALATDRRLDEAGRAPLVAPFTSLRSWDRLSRWGTEPLEREEGLPPDRFGALFATHRGATPAPDR